MTRSAPDNAGVILDLQARTYASPPCVINGDIEQELIKNRSDVRDMEKELVLEDYALLETMGEARTRRKERGWRADAACSRVGGFSQTMSGFQWLTGYPSRWDTRGDWRW
jgi:hypothetical protein